MPDSRRITDLFQKYLGNRVASQDVISREVSVLVARITVPSSQGLRAERLAAVQSALLKAALGATSREGGDVDAVLGLSVLAVFDAWAESDEHVVRSVRAADSFLSDGIVADLQSEGFVVTVAIAAGEATVTRAESRTRTIVSLIGTPILTAIHLAGRAESGLLITRQVADVVGSNLNLRSRIRIISETA